MAGGELRLVVELAATGQQLCALQMDASDTVGDLHRAVSDALQQGCGFDLIVAGQVFPNSVALGAAGLRSSGAVQLVRRQLVAGDIALTKYSEGCMGCLRFSYQPLTEKGAELHLLGMRCGYGDFMSFEWYSDPSSVQDCDEGVFAYYRKVVRDVGEDVRTRHVSVRRPLRLRGDLVIARQADGCRWVPFRRDAGEEAGSRAGGAEGCHFPIEGIPVVGDLPDGRRLEVLDEGAGGGEWLRVRCPSHGEGWVRLSDVERLGEVSLDWAGPEEVLTEVVLE